MNRKFKLLALTSLSLFSVAGISMAVISCSDKKETEAAEITALKAFIDGTTETKDKAVSAKTTLKDEANVST
jgi:hypothetical protein